MTISINHATSVISIPKSDTTFVLTNAGTGYEVRSYDEYALMRELADYLDSENGVALPSAFTHATEVTISGVTYARSLLILSPYTVTFENGSYQVKLVGGTNNNLLDVLNPNSVSVIPANSAGLQTIDSGAVVAPTQQQIRDAMTLATAETPAAGSIDDQIASVPTNPLLANDARLDKLALIEKVLRNKTVTDPTTGVMTVYEDDGVTPYLTADLYENAAGSQDYRGQGAERRDRLA